MKRRAVRAKTDATVKRWQRRLRMWRQNPQPENVRLTLLVDGLNQTAATNWGRYIDGIAQRLSELGGSLVLTTRAGHWAQIRTSLACAPVRVPVENWSADELKELLRTHNINADMLSADTFETLRNPRIFCIAVELLAAKDIEQIDELSVERLMFEHMRQSEQSGASRLSGQEFATLLRKLAQEILDRAGKQEKDDLHVFDTGQVESLRAVASCRFFEPLRRDTSLYRITPPGLGLGLALWLVAALERELDNDRHPRGQLTSILEPISVLDETARIVQHAVELACLDDNTSIEVRAALIEHFVSLQNLPQTAEVRLAELRSRMMASALVVRDVLERDHDVPPVARADIAIIDGAGDCRDETLGIFALADLDWMLRIEGACAAITCLRDLYGTMVRGVLDQRCAAIVALRRGQWPMGDPGFEAGKTETSMSGATNLDGEEGAARDIADGYAARAVAMTQRLRPRVAVGIASRRTH